MTRLTQTEQTLLAILRAALRGERLKAGELPKELDWGALVKLAAAHKVLPLLVDAVPAECLPNPAIKRSALEQVVFQTVNTQAFLTLYEKLESRGVRALVVKGIVCRALYPKSDLRPSADEDLLVSDGEFDRCCELLRLEGFSPTGTPGENDGEIGWRKPGSGLYIELHRRLFDPQAGTYSAMEALFDHTGAGSVRYDLAQGGSVRSMPPQEHLLYLLLHAYKHFLHSGFGIRQVCDIGLWAKRYADRIDWEWLMAQCALCRAEGFAGAVFGIAADALGIEWEMPKRMRLDGPQCEPLLLDVLCGGVYGSADLDRLHSATMTLNAVRAQQTGNRQGLLRTLFPERMAMERKYGYLRRYPALLPLAWGQRIVGYLNGSRHENTGAQASLAIGRERIELLKLYGVLD